MPLNAFIIAKFQAGAKNIAKFCKKPPKPPADWVKITKNMVLLSKADFLANIFSLNFSLKKKTNTNKKLKIPIQIMPWKKDRFKKTIFISTKLRAINKDAHSESFNKFLFSSNFFSKEIIILAINKIKRANKLFSFMAPYPKKIRLKNSINIGWMAPTMGITLDTSNFSTAE